MIRDYLIFFGGFIIGLVDLHLPPWVIVLCGFGAGFVINLTRKDD